MLIYHVGGRATRVWVITTIFRRFVTQCTRTSNWLTVQLLSRFVGFPLPLEGTSGDTAAMGLYSRRCWSHRSRSETSARNLNNAHSSTHTTTVSSSGQIRSESNVDSQTTMRHYQKLICLNNNAALVEDDGRKMFGNAAVERHSVPSAGPVLLQVGRRFRWRAPSWRACLQSNNWRESPY